MNRNFRYCIFCVLLVFAAALNAQPQLDSQYTGVGIIFSLDSSRGYKIPVINAVVPDAPAEAAGLRAGDMVVAVNRSIFAGRIKPWDEDTKLIGGAAGNLRYLGY